MQKALDELLGRRVPLERGKLLHGKKETYRIEELISCGGHSLIYRARGEAEQKEYVIKETYPNTSSGLRHNKNGLLKILFNNDEKILNNIIRRAEKEQDIIKMLTGAAGKYTDYVEWEIESFKANNTFYAVGKYSGYEPLPKNNVNLFSALHYMKRLLFAIEPIHEAGLLHLDISPGNILQTNMEKDEPAPVLKIIDFGSSYTLKEIQSGEAIPEFTRSGDFTAPELRGRIDIRKIGYGADIYSLGKIFCYLIGIERIDGNDRLIERDDKCAEGINQGAILLANELIVKALHPTPSDRHGSVSEMRQLVCEAIAKAEEPTLVHNNYRHPYPHFVGRKDKIAEIAEILDDKEKHNYVFLEGIGGIGKSELSKRYAWESEKIGKYDNIQFIEFHENLCSTVVSSLKFSNFHPQAYKNSAEIFEAKMNLLKKQDEKTLIIVDNYDEEYDDDFWDFASGKYKVIFTSREKHDGNVIILDSMCEDDLLALFYKYYFAQSLGDYPVMLNNKDEPILRNIIKDVLGHTMTVMLVASGMRVNEITPREMYNRLLNSLDPNLKKAVALDKEKVKKAERNQLIYQHILNLFNMAMLTEKEKYVMTNMAIVPYSGLAVDDFYHWISDDPYESEALADINQKLIKLRWVQCDGEIISLHRVISEVTNSKLMPDSIKCTGLIEAYLQFKNTSNGRTYVEQVYYRENLMKLACERICDETMLTAKLTNEFAQLSYLLKRYKTGIKYDEKAAAIVNVLLKYAHTEEYELFLEGFLTEVYRAMGRAYSDSKEYDNAIEHFNKSIEREEYLYHHKKLINEDGLAISYRERGIAYAGMKKYEESLSDINKSITLFLKSSSEIRDELASAYMGRHDTYKPTRRFDEAMIDIQMSIDIWEQLKKEGKVITENNLSKAYERRSGLLIQGKPEMHGDIFTCIEGRNMINVIINQRKKQQNGGKA